MKDLLEAFLFLAAEPVRPKEVAAALDCSEEEVQASLSQLVLSYEAAGGGLQIVSIAGGFQMSTRAHLAQDLGRLLASPSGKQRLSRAALETLAIVAYRQPITQAQIEAVRGVSADGVLRTLIDRTLLREDGRMPTPGRPILYATTDSFLHYFGLASVADLPPLDETHSATEDAVRDVERAVGFIGADDAL